MSNPHSPQFERPTVTELGAFSGFALSADTEQQQQQQQQQSTKNQVRRYLNDDGLPQEEVVSTLTTEIRQTNQIAPRSK
jgi:hypothetical protein